MEQLRCDPALELTPDSMRMYREGMNQPLRPELAKAVQFAASEILPGEDPALVVNGFLAPEFNRFMHRLTIEQTHAGWREDLRLAGFECRADERKTGGLKTRAVNEESKIVLIATYRSRERTVRALARAAAFETGTLISVAAENDQGAPGYTRLLRDICGETETISKAHCKIAFTVLEPARVNTELVAEITRGPIRVPVVGTPLHTRPGYFSADKVDAGSALLASYLPDDLDGRGYDLGAGYGYLSWVALTRSPAIKRLELIEVESELVEAVDENFSGEPRVSARWADVTRVSDALEADFVLMNPPFHEGAKADPGLGIAFIRIAAQVLKTHGRLFLVANRRLPYERELSGLFQRCKVLVESGGYKVIEASK